MDIIIEIGSIMRSVCTVCTQRWLTRNRAIIVCIIIDSTPCVFVEKAIYICTVAGQPWNWLLFTQQSVEHCAAFEIQ